MTWDYTIDLDTDGVIDSSGTKYGSSILVELYNVKVGNHRVTWSVRDGCNNSTSCTQQFKVEDGKAPGPYCLSGLTTSLHPNSGTVELWAIDFDNGSADDCYDRSELEFSFSGSTIIPNRTFTCDDLNGASSASIDLEVWVWDPVGNKDFCRTKIEVSDHTDACGTVVGNGLMADIAGKINTPSGANIDDVEVYLNGAITGVTEVDLTDTDGRYMFDDNDMYKNYRITAQKNKDHVEGLTTIDIILIQRHILGLSRITNPYLMVAADVNGDGKISGTDLISLRNVIMGFKSEFPNNSSWRFMDAKFAMNATDPYNFPERISVDNIEQDIMDNDFIGIKIGDINGSRENIGQSDLTITRSRGFINWEYAYIDIPKAEVGSYEFTADKALELSGFQVAINIGLNEFVGFDGGFADLSEANYHVVKIDNETIVNVSWNSNQVRKYEAGEILFTMRAKSIADQQVNFKLQETKTLINEAYEGYDLEALDITLSPQSEKIVEMVLYQNEPNPFVDETIIKFELPEKEMATISIYDIAGQLVHEQEIDAKAGVNTYEVNRNMLTSSNVYIYRVRTEKYSAQKSMITINN